MKAIKESWRIRPMTSVKTTLDIQAEYSEEEYTKMSEGFIPAQMEDKWFIYMEDGTLYFHRSWTGDCIFEVRFAKDGDKYTVKEAFTRELKHKGDQQFITYMGKMLLFLTDAILLHKDVIPPEMEGNKQNPAESFCERFHLYGFQGVGKWEIDAIVEVMNEIKKQKGNNDIED